MQDHAQDKRAQDGGEDKKGHRSGWHLQRNMRDALNNFNREWHDDDREHSRRDEQADGVVFATARLYCFFGKNRWHRGHGQRDESDVYSRVQIERESEYQGGHGHYDVHRQKGADKKSRPSKEIGVICDRRFESESEDRERDTCLQREQQYLLESHG